MDCADTLRVEFLFAQAPCVSISATHARMLAALPALESLDTCACTTVPLALTPPADLLAHWALACIALLQGVIAPVLRARLDWLLFLMRVADWGANADTVQRFRDALAAHDAPLRCAHDTDTLLEWLDARQWLTHADGKRASAVQALCTRSEAECVLFLMRVRDAARRTHQVAYTGTMHAASALDCYATLLDEAAVCIANESPHSVARMLQPLEWPLPRMPRARVPPAAAARRQCVFGGAGVRRCGGISRGARAALRRADSPA